MSDIVVYDPADPIVAGRVTDYRISVHTPDWEGNPNTLVNPDLSGVSGVPQIYWKESTGSIVEMSAGEKTAIDDDLAPVPESKCISFDSGGTSIDGNHRLLVIASTGNDNIGFIVPVDFVSLVSLELIGYAIDGTAFGASKDIDLVSEYALDGELRNNTTESDTVTTYTAGSALKEWFEWDISGVFSSIAAEDRCSLNIEHKTDVGGNIGYLGIEMTYNLS